MAMLNALLRSLYRHVVRADSNDMPDIHVRLRETGGWGHIGQHGARNESRQIVSLCESIRSYILRAQNKNAQAWQDALQMERRAKRRSLCLLLKLLTPEQRREFRQSRQFQVIGGCTGVRYRIRYDPFSNIDVLYPNGTVRHQLCVQPAGDIPVYDKMAAQLLHLQDPGTETRLLCKANILPARAGRYMPPVSATRH